MLSECILIMRENIHGKKKKNAAWQENQHHQNKVKNKK